LPVEKRIKMILVFVLCIVGGASSFEFTFDGNVGSDESGKRG
jgi:hypothetical protein